MNNPNDLELANKRKSYINKNNFLLLGLYLFTFILALLISFMPIFDIGTNGHNFVSPLLVSYSISYLFMFIIPLSVSVVLMIIKSLFSNLVLEIVGLCFSLYLLIISIVSSTQLNFHFVSIIALTFLTFVELSINVVSLIQFIKSKKTK